MSVFQIEETKGYFTIFWPEKLNGTAASNFPLEIKAWLDSPSQVFIFNFKNVTSLSRVCYKYIAPFQELIQGQGKTLATINVSPELQMQIRADGLTAVFNICEDLTEVKRLPLSTAQIKRSPKLDTKFINPFITSTIDTFSTQIGISLIPQKPYAGKMINNNIAISAVLQIEGQHFTGAFGICFPKKVFLKVYDLMLDEKHEEIDEEVSDAAGEILNIIYGRAKAILNNETGYILNKSIPSILIGQKISEKFNQYEPTIVLPFKSNIGPFYIEILTKEE